MGHYHHLYCKLIVKTEFIPVIARVVSGYFDIDYGKYKNIWHLAASDYPEYEFLLMFSASDRCQFIPFGGPQSSPFGDEPVKFDPDTGLFEFSCSTKNLNTVMTFISHVLPKIAGEVHVCETAQDDCREVHRHRFDLALQALRSDIDEALEAVEL